MCLIWVGNGFGTRRLTVAFLILIAFLTVPIAEIAVFIHVGGQIGPWPTVGVVILTAVLGTAL